MRKTSLVIIVLASLIVASGCRKSALPKEYGYFRIDLPKEHIYAPFEESGYPYTFLLSEEAKVVPIEQEDECYWIDIVYPAYHAKVHCSYKKMNKNLKLLSDDAQEFVFSHAMKASAIPEKMFSHPEAGVYGLVYDFEGNTATPFQFYLTDSLRHFFRGSLYFNAIPNQDSIAPVAEYIREDMTTLIESFRWIQ